MATVDKNFKIKNGLIVGDSTNLVNYTSSSPSDPFVGQLWINEPFLYAWSSASTWVLIGDGTASGGGAVGGGSASGTPLNISNTLVARSASGTFAIGAIDFDTTASPVLSVGRMQWNQNFGTPEVGLIGGNVTANIGQHVHAYVTNDEGSSLVAGDVVYLFGATGDRASVKKAYNLSDATSSKTFGVVAETIAAGQAGFVTVFGVVNKLNLSSYNPGDVLWLSASPGKFTSIKPSAPQHLVFVGVVEKANAGNGQLFVNVQNGYELEELHSVQITNLTDNDILSYNGSSSLWFNQNLSTAIQEVDGAGSGIDADLLDAQQGSYYLDWTNTTNKPDPIVGVNLIGEVTGAASATLTDLTNGQISITTTISPDSVILGTDTTGNYVAGATGGNGIVISGTAGEGWSPTISLHSSALTASVSGTSPTAAGSNGFRNITISTSAATGGNDGDVWLVYV